MNGQILDTLQAGDRFFPITARLAVRQAAWGWFAAHADDVVVQRRVLFFALTIRVRDLRPLFVTLFGADPMGGALPIDGPPLPPPTVAS